MIIKRTKKLAGYALKNLEILLEFPPFKFIWRLIHYLRLFGISMGLKLVLKELKGSKEIIHYKYKDSLIAIRLNSSDVYVLMNILVYQEYIIELKRKPRFIVDAGAYTGISTIYFAEKYPDATIIAIEPDADNFSMLKKNTAKYSKIVCLQKALWSKSDIVSMTDRKVGHWGFTMSKFEKNKKGMIKEIETVNIPWIMENFNIEYIDLLKVDIEGSEKEVLENSTEWIGKVGVIAVELHDRINKGCKTAFYNATGSFEYKLKKGENVFKIRKSYYLN
ncbi:MAG: FkbM family methyltransferase [Thermodesulfobacteriota bacterium]